MKLQVQIPCSMELAETAARGVSRALSARAQSEFDAELVMLGQHDKTLPLRKNQNIDTLREEFRALFPTDLTNTEVRGIVDIEKGSKIIIALRETLKMDLHLVLNGARMDITAQDSPETIVERYKKSVAFEVYGSDFFIPDPGVLISSAGIVALSRLFDRPISYNRTVQTGISEWKEILLRATPESHPCDIEIEYAKKYRELTGQEYEYAYLIESRTREMVDSGGEVSIEVEKGSSFSKSLLRDLEQLGLKSSIPIYVDDLSLEDESVDQIFEILEDERLIRDALKVSIWEETQFSDAADIALEVARQTSKSVRLFFNGNSVRVTPDSDSQSIEKDFLQKLNLSTENLKGDAKARLSGEVKFYGTQELLCTAIAVAKILDCPLCVDLPSERRMDFAVTVVVHGKMTQHDAEIEFGLADARACSSTDET